MLILTNAFPDEDKDLAKLLTGYQDMIGLLSVHKVARINTQVSNNFSCRVDCHFTRYVFNYIVCTQGQSHKLVGVKHAFNKPR